MRKLAIIILLNMVGCSLVDPRTGTVQLDEVFELRYEGVATVKGEGLAITFVSVEEDIRCPPRRVCWGPRGAVVQLKLTTETDGQRVLFLNTRWARQWGFGSPLTKFPGSVDTLGYRISLIGLEPIPTFQGEIFSSEEYSVRIEVMEPWHSGTINLFDTDSYDSYSQQYTGVVKQNLMWLDGDSLVLPLEYDSGCKKHEFYLVGTCPPDISNPAPLTITVLHDWSSDSCYAWLADTLKFDLAPLRTCGLAADSVALEFDSADTPTLLFGL